MTHHDKNVLTRSTPPGYEQNLTSPEASQSADPECGCIPNYPWNVVYAHHNSERIAARELAERGYPHHLPMQAVVKMHRGERAVHHVPMFSQYLFCQIPLGMSAADIWYLPGVRSLFSTPQKRPIALPGGFVERLIREAPERLKLVSPALPVIEVGVRVRALDGPMTGHMGDVLACDGLITRVDMELFGRPCPVELRRVDLEVVV